MADPVTELYEAVGVDTKGLQHKIRTRWNKMDSDERTKQLAYVREHPRRYAHLRWDQLPNNIQKAVVASVRRRKKRDN